MLAPSTPSDPTVPLVGALRDAVTTANGVLLLLRSRNVAPKAIAQLLPSLEDSFRSLPSQYTEFCERVLAAGGAGGPLPGSLQCLGPLLSQQIDGFNTAIETGNQSSVNARARLSLEQAVLGTSHQLSALLAVFELWADTLRPRAVVDLVELLTLSRVGDQPPIPHRQVLHLKLAPSSGPCLIHAPPRAVLNWLGLAASVVHLSRPGTDPGIRLSNDDQENILAFEPLAGASSHFLALQLPAVIGETEHNLVDAVGALGVRTTTTETGLSFRWTPGELVMTGAAN